jgi:hypothetical protein
MTVQPPSVGALPNSDLLPVSGAEHGGRRFLDLDLGGGHEALRGSPVINGEATYFDAKNLLNTPLKFTEGTSESRPIQREFYDVTLIAGVRASL